MKEKYSYLFYDNAKKAELLNFFVGRNVHLE